MFNFFRVFDFIHFGVSDLLDIAGVAFLLYQVYKLIRGTAALNIFTGIFLIYLLWVIVRALNMQLLSTIMEQILGVGLIALIVVFQQEIRRFLLALGSKFNTHRYRWVRRVFKMASPPDVVLDMDALTMACRHMAESKTGALIVIGRRSGLEMYAATGDTLNARISNRLLENLFFKNSPLHDGAVIIVNNRILAARCTLPISERANIPAHYGMRHRAATGLTEHTDAIVIVVSEETGKISVVDNGTIHRMDGGANEMRMKVENLLKTGN